jgi:uncharacterized membrane protein YgcG
VQYFDTHLWQAVLFAFLGAPFVGAYIIALAPMLLRLLPQGGGLGERLGMLLGPFNLCGVALAYVAAGVVDATGNYRLIWLFPAATGVAHAVVNLWLRFPPRRQAGPDPVKRLWEWAIVQAEAMAETGIVTGLLTAPLLGEVTVEDADSAVVIDLARSFLGNPYEPDEPAEPSVGSEVAGGASTPAGGAGGTDGTATGSTGGGGTGGGGPDDGGGGGGTGGGGGAATPGAIGVRDTDVPDGGVSSPDAGPD